MTKLSSLKSKLSAFTADESGATIIEYAVLAALIVVVCIAIVRTLGLTLAGRFGDIQAEVAGI